MHYSFYKLAALNTLLYLVYSPAKVLRMITSRLANNNCILWAYKYR